MPVPLLRDRLNGLPLVLAGPMLRRTEPGGVTVWVALRRPRTVRLQVSRRTAGGTWEVVQSGEAPTVALGAALHVVAVTARPGQTLQWGQQYGYNLSFDLASGAPADGVATGNLFQPGVLAATTAEANRLLLYTHAEDAGPSAPALPSFALSPTDLNALRLCHGSCRKAHGESLDGLAALDEIVKLALRPGATAPRPHFALFGGDQIYADDVADALLWLLWDAGETLLAGLPPPAPPEPPWVADVPPPSREVVPGVVTSDDLRPGHRARFTQRIKLTAWRDDSPGAAKSHLLRLSEFYAMYLFVWSDVLWPRPGGDGLWQAFPDYGVLYPTGKPLPWGGLEPGGYADEVARLGALYRTLPRVRRALANVPIYTIFDDHEVTDDWNLNREWCSWVYGAGNPAGRRLVQNGLLAYAVFQAWGNTPERFASGQPGAALLGAAAGWYGGASQAQRDKERVLLEALRVPLYQGNDPVPPEANAVAPVPWHYGISGPGYEAIVLDTRTQRAFPGGLQDAPELLSPAAFGAQIPTTPPPADGVTLLVTPTNLVSEYLTEKAVEYGKEHMSVYWGDAGDAWTGQTHGFELLLSRLATRAPDSGAARRVARVVVLTGDIHYGFAFRTQYWGERPYQAPAPPGKPVDAVFAELTSSPFRHEAAKTRALHQAKKSSPFTDEWLGWRTPPTVPQVRVGSVVRTLKDNKLWRLRRAPAMLSIPLIRAILQIALPPDWRYRIDMIGDLSRGLPVTDVVVPFPDREEGAGWWLNRASDVGFAYVALASAPGTMGRFIVGRNNMGEVRFSWGAGDQKAVTQQLWWRRTDTEPALPWTTFTVSLAINEAQRYPKPTFPGDAG